MAELKALRAAHRLQEEAERSLNHSEDERSAAFWRRSKEYWRRSDEIWDRRLKKWGVNSNPIQESSTTNLASSEKQFSGQHQGNQDATHVLDKTPEQETAPIIFQESAVEVPATSEGNDTDGDGDDARDPLPADNTQPQVELCPASHNEQPSALFSQQIQSPATTTTEMMFGSSLQQPAIAKSSGAGSLRVSPVSSFQVLETKIWTAKPRDKGGGVACQLLDEMPKWRYVTQEHLVDYELNSGLGTVEDLAECDLTELINSISFVIVAKTCLVDHPEGTVTYIVAWGLLDLTVMDSKKLHDCWVVKATAFKGGTSVSFLPPCGINIFDSPWHEFAASKFLVILEPCNNYAFWSSAAIGKMRQLSNP